MKQIMLQDGVQREVLEVFGGVEQYQDTRREYLEFVLPQEGNTVEALEVVFSAENCESITLVDPDSGEKFIHESYVLRGTVRVFPGEDGVWCVAVKRYQQTQMEREVAALREVVALLQKVTHTD